MRCVGLIFINTRFPVARVTPSIVWPFANDDANVPAAVVATLTDFFTSNPVVTLST